MFWELGAQAEFSVRKEHWLSPEDEREQLVKRKRTVWLM
jgi:hypothetical protein